MKTLGFGRSKSITLRFWTHQDQQSCVGTRFGGSRIAPELANLCWYRYCGTRASKPELVHTKGHRSPKVQADSEVWESLIVKSQLLRI